MASSSFIDYVKIYCRSGKGGAGSLHFHRAKYVPKGGPDGGDGGRGGHIILRGNRNLWTLLHLKYQKHIFATDGGHGGPSRSFGKDGEDKVIEVPCGTVVYNGDTGEYMCEIKHSSSTPTPVLPSHWSRPTSIRLLTTRPVARITSTSLPLRTAPLLWTRMARFSL